MQDLLGSGKSASPMRPVRVNRNLPCRDLNLRPPTGETSEDGQLNTVAAAPARPSRRWTRRSRSRTPAGAHRSSHAPAQGEAPKQDSMRNTVFPKSDPMQGETENQLYKSCMPHSWPRTQSQSELRHDLEHGQRVQGR